MMYDLKHHQRRSIRLCGYDYASHGAYFITICVQDRTCLFGDAIDGEVRFSDAGRMVHSTWDEIPAYYPGVELDASIIMPNHIHGIIILVGATPRGCPSSGWQYGGKTGQPLGANKTGQPRGVAPTTVLSLPDVVHRFKTLTTSRYVDGVKQLGWEAFHGRLWQRNYYEHIIRNEESLNRIRRYILDNPGRWSHDRENPLVAFPETVGGWPS